MGDWSEAMEDGVICRGCAMPFGDSPGTADGYCELCASIRSNSREGNQDPGWLPGNGSDRTFRK